MSYREELSYLEDRFGGREENIVDTSFPKDASNPLRKLNHPNLL